MEQTEKANHTDHLLTCLQIICKFHGQPASAESITFGLPLDEGRLTPSSFGRAAARLGFTSQIERQPLTSLNGALFPAVLLLKGDRACVVDGIDAEQGTASLVHPELPESEAHIPLDDLADEYTGNVLYCRPKFRLDQRSHKNRSAPRGHWFWGVIAENRRLYRDICIAALMINLFAVAMPLFVMNVYDRVVPNNATHTLWCCD